MPSTYVLKNSPIDRNRLHKVCKKVIDEANEDRKFALDTIDFLGRCWMITPKMLQLRISW